MKSVLVTGADGFIGRHCVSELLELGFEVHAVTRRQHMPPGSGALHWHHADLLSDDDIVRVAQSARASNLLHLAWIADPAVFWSSEMNLEWLRAGIRVVTAFRQSGGRRVVVNGSCAEYAIPETGACVEDITPILPATLYGKAKAALHLVLQGYAERAGISLGWARTFFVYGPQEPPAKAVSSMIADRRAGRIPCIREPHRLLDYIYVSDAGRALALLVQSEFSGAVNVAGGRPVTLLDIWRCICAAIPLEETGEPAPPTGQLTGSRGDLYADTTRLRQRLNFSSRYSLAAGVFEMLRAVQTTDRR